jgi:hypothetical protein
MVVAVAAVGMVEVPTHDIINMVPVRCAFMPAFWAVNVFTIVSFAFVVGGAAVWVGAPYGNGVLIDVAVVDVM